MINVNAIKDALYENRKIIYIIAKDEKKIILPMMFTELAETECDLKITIETDS